MNIYTGIVQSYQGRAASLGYPTVNIPLAHGASGIFAARVRIGNAEHPAVAFADPTRKVLEAHLLDFSGDLYGTKIVIELLGKIRDTKHFADDKSLRRAIANDIAKTRRYFRSPL